MTTLTSDGMLAVAASLGVQTLPTVLALRPRHTDHEEFAAARAATATALCERGVLDAGGDVLDDELTTALFTLARPDRQLVMRIRRDDTVTRLCLARRGLDHALAVRTADDLDVRAVWGDDVPATLARPLLTVLGPCPPADLLPFSVPTAELQERFDATDFSYADAAYRLGMPESDAVTLGLALRECRSVAELVCYSHGEARPVRAGASAAIYDTPAGRIIGSGSVAADGRAWTTLAPGGDGRLAQAIAALIEALPEGRWMP
ncbi:ESX secretion-associated protein EspG [Nocardia sp. NEAU-G5]|uniref:ESX secretion-associated protein EspG n=1 Tax=Nocardia albiluteola TaxID=2842303 RepID=A0ABS6BF70_9NOCA|nr:ESX secretion-associated protein EspG [Nocardia albiluteola]MBU3068080.1 ESX secretion-associated protein EspG [Nocardia albiluteola]